jgi:hypothetical protein
MLDVCHEECPGEGGGNLLATFQEAIEVGDSDLVAAYVAMHPVVTFSSQRGALLLPVGCGAEARTVELSLPPVLHARLRSLLHPVRASEAGQ